MSAVGGNSIALFSSGWLADTFTMDVLVLIRHPAAFAGSIVRQGWDHPFDHFLRQPLMMRDLLDGYEDEIRRFVEVEQPLLDQAILLWNLIHRQIIRFRDERPGWTFLRHEDLSREPIEGFRALYDRFDLTWTDDAWKARFTPEEVDRIRRGTEAVAAAFYSDDDW